MIYLVLFIFTAKLTSMSKKLTCTVKRLYGDYGAGVHLFPFRTEQLSPAALMVLPSPVGE